MVTTPSLWLQINTKSSNNISISCSSQGRFTPLSIRAHASLNGLQFVHIHESTAWEPNAVAWADQAAKGGAASSLCQDLIEQLGPVIADSSSGSFCSSGAMQFGAGGWGMQEGQWNFISGPRVSFQKRVSFYSSFSVLQKMLSTFTVIQTWDVQQFI